MKRKYKFKTVWEIQDFWSDILIKDYSKEFIKESLKIEGINRDPTPLEIREFKRFMKLKMVNIKQLEKFVSIYQPEAKLRISQDMRVRVGNRVCPWGGKDLIKSLNLLLESVNRMSLQDRIKNASSIHYEYERLHPFTDCNGRSGRMLWAWMMHEIPHIGFLHKFYYQILALESL